MIADRVSGVSAARGNAPGRIAAAMAACVMLIFTASAVQAQAREALFLGIMDEKGGPVQSELEQAVRNALAANPKIKLADMLETQRFVREKERLGRGNAENFIPPGIKLDSSTVLIKGIAEEPSFELKRHRLLWGKVDARLFVKFYFEDISGKANYQGILSARAVRKKDLLLFASPRKNIHISVADRMEILSEMQAKIVKDVSDLAGTFFNALTGDAEADTADAVNAADTADTGTANQENEPSEPSAAEQGGAPASE